MSEQQLGRKDEQRDEGKDREEPEQPKTSRSAGRVVRSLSETLFFGSLNAQQSAAIRPMSMKDAITNCSLRFQPRRNGNLFRNCPYRKRRQRLEALRQRLQGKVPIPTQRSQLLNGSLHNHRSTRRIHVPSRRHHVLMKRGRMDDLTRSVYPNFTPASFGRLSPPHSHPPPPLPPNPNTRDLPHGLLPLHEFNPGFRSVPPDFYLPPQTASGAGAPPGFYLPLQATPGIGMQPGLMSHRFHPPLGFGAVSDLYAPPPVATGTAAPPGIFPLPQVPFGISISSGSFPPQPVPGVGTPLGFSPLPQGVPGLGAPLTFQPLSQPAFGISPMLPFSQQDLSHEKSDQASAASQSIIPPPELSLSTEMFDTVPSASTSTASTAIPPTSPSQQITSRPRQSEPAYERELISTRSGDYRTVTANVPSLESLEFTPQLSLPIVRLRGGLFVYNCEERMVIVTQMSNQRCHIYNFWLSKSSSNKRLIDRFAYSKAL
uniref:Vegetative cell wall protein gp1 n=1 Tax=Elaeophora elaphi TaxID=1147741 RepID=A0A0R3S3C6_9BILA